MIFPRSIENLKKKKKRRNKAIVSDDGSIEQNAWKMKYKCSQKSLTVATSHKNHAYTDQFDCRGHDGVIGLDERRREEKKQGHCEQTTALSDTRGR